MTNTAKHKWSSSFGFIMASVGAALGLGNIWGFPYKLGQGGGFVYLLFYLLFVVFAGFPMLICELSLGRATAQPAVKAFSFFNRKFALAGILGLIACFIILSYYSFFGGMILKYLFSYFGLNIDSTIYWHLLFMFITLLIVTLGVQKGVENSCKIMVPALIVILIYISIVTLSLPSSGEALKFLFAPDFSKLNLHTISTAMTQVFFSLSLGQGCMVTYGSYLNKNSPLLKEAAMIPIFDTGTALLAAVAIMPAVFALGIQPTLGPDLMFRAIPEVFAGLKGGRVLAILFFITVFFAALASAVSMLETLVSEVEAKGKVSRNKASVIIGCLCAAAGLPVCLGYGGGSGYRLFYIYEFVSQYFLMCVSSLLLCLLVIYVWKPENAIEAAFGNRRKLGKLWLFCVKYICPPLLLLVIVSMFFSGGG
jgi:NSS family neurotransmitter:Na+ symporter